MLPLRHCLNTQWHYANKFSTYVVLQVEIILQGWQSGHLHGHLCCWFPCQHATPLIRLSIGPPVPVIHGADIVGSVSGNGHSRLCFIILVYVQDFCFSQGRLDIKQQSWDRTSVSDMLRECARTKLARVHHLASDQTLHFWLGPTGYNASCSSLFCHGRTAQQGCRMLTRVCTVQLSV